MMNKLALLLLSASWCLRASWGQEAGENTQTEEAFAEELYGNNVNDSAVAGIWYRESLYVAISTESELGGDDFGGFDIVVKSFDDSLDEDLAVQLGGDGDDIIYAIAAPPVVDDDLSSDVVIVGSTESEEVHLVEDQVNATGGQDWFVATLARGDLETNVIFVDGTEFEAEAATAVAVTADGEYIVAGTTAGDYFGENAGSSNGDDDDLGLTGFDFWVVKMDADLSEDFVWSVQGGTTAYDTPTAVVVDDDGNVYVVGNVNDFSDVLTDAEEEETASMFVYCYDEDGEELWSVTDELGFMSDAGAVYGAVLTNNGTTQLYVSGNTRGIIGDFEGNTTDTDELFIVSLDPSTGDINWVWQSEGNATAFGTGGIALADDGLTPIVSGIAFGNHFNLSFTYFESGSGNMIAAMVGTEELEVLKYYVANAENSDTRQDPLALVKVEDEEFGVYMMGTNDGEWGEDSDPEDTTNYLILKVELEDLPEEEEEGDSGYDFPYWYVGVPLFAIGGLLFLGAYKWAAASQAAKAKQATMV